MAVKIQRKLRQIGERRIDSTDKRSSLFLQEGITFAGKKFTMAFIFHVEGKYPEFGENCYIAPNATIAGDVIMGNDCSIWFNAVVRGDVNSIRIGDKVNIQDGAVIHCTYQRTQAIIGNNVSIGHNAIVHGCLLHDNVLVGMGAIIMDHAVVHSNTIIAAGAVVLEGTVCEAGSIYAGIPAKKVKAIEAEQISGEINRIANNYMKYADWFRGQSGTERS
jgi:carbonic anhydrase/acetyltransferase-like protein (isoleucine patch superfamily)